MMIIASRNKREGYYAGRLILDLATMYKHKHVRSHVRRGVGKILVISAMCDKLFKD